MTAYQDRVPIASHRSEVLAKLRTAAGDPRFTETDVLAIAELQKELSTGGSPELSRSMPSSSSSAGTS